MAKFKNLLSSYRKSINPPYKGSDFIVIGATLLTLLIAYVVIISLPNKQNDVTHYPRKSSAQSVTPAPGTAVVSVEPSTQTVTAGQTVSVAVIVNSGTSPINAVQTTITYPPNLLTKTAQIYGSAFGMQAVETIAPGSISIARGTITPVSGVNNIVTITFLANASGNATIALSDSLVISSTSNLNILSATSNGNIIIEVLNPTTTQTTPSPTSQVTDSIAPQVSITSPINGATVIRGKATTISASATDNVGVTKVDFFVNNKITCSDAIAPYACTWRVPSAKSRSYSLSARAYDAAGNSSANSIINVIAR